eukprot:scaffold69321_cov73-Phaeocystis_antarctica.AAC.2
MSSESAEKDGLKCPRARPTAALSSRPSTPSSSSRTLSPRCPAWSAPAGAAPASRCSQTRQVLVVFDPLDRGQVLVLLDQRLLVLALASQPRVALRGPRVGRRAPQPHVGVIGAGEHVGVVCRPEHGEEALHALRVVDLHRLGLGRLPDAQRLVVGARDELLACGRVVDVEHRRDVPLVHADGVVELTHVEGVKVVVLGRRREVEGLHGVPADGVLARLHCHLLHRAAAAHVVQRDAPVVAQARQQVALDRVEPDARHSVRAPAEALDGLGARGVPQLHRRPARGEHVLFVVVVHVRERVRAQPLGQRLRLIPAGRG